jgi:hypothetical protein
MHGRRCDWSVTFLECRLWNAPCEGVREVIINIIGPIYRSVDNNVSTHVGESPLRNPYILYPSLSASVDAI